MTFNDQVIEDQAQNLIEQIKFIFGASTKISIIIRPEDANTVILSNENDRSVLEAYAENVIAPPDVLH